MDPKIYKKSKNTYFNSPKKEPLVKKMIFDPYEGYVPASCYELRPINQGQSNQQDIIFDPKSNSLREISQFDKNSPYELDKLMYGHNQNSNQSVLNYIDSERGQNSLQYQFKVHEESSSLSESYRAIKRQNPISHEQAQIHESISKMVRITEGYDQDIVKKQQLENLHFSRGIQVSSNQIPMKQSSVKKSWAELVKSQRKAKWPSRLINSSMKKEKIFNEDMEDDEEEQQKQTYKLDQQINTEKVIKQQDQVKIEEVSAELNLIQTCKPSYKKPQRKRVENPEFQLINQYTELASYAALVDEMIMVYDKSPIFEFPLDFDSQTDQEDEPQSQNSIPPESHQKIENDDPIQEEVKIEHIDQEKSSNQITKKQQRISKSQKELYNQFEKLKLQEATDERDKQRIIKEIKFNRSKMYCNFFEPIKQLKPYMKKMSLEEKKLFLAFKKELKQIKDILDHFQRKRQGEKKDHICKLCGEEFESGRQLGGHMSRKHPGKAIEYGFKKELHKIKEIERKRRRYFKELEGMKHDSKLN